MTEPTIFQIISHFANLAEIEKHEQEEKKKVKSINEIENLVSRKLLSFPDIYLVKTIHDNYQFSTLSGNIFFSISEKSAVEHLACTTLSSELRDELKNIAENLSFMLKSLNFDYNKMEPKENETMSEDINHGILVAKLPIKTGIQDDNMEEPSEKTSSDTPIELFNFSRALVYLKKGKKLSRTGWNGKNMFVVLQKAYPEGIKCNEQTAEAWDLAEGDLFKVNPYMQIKNVDGSHSMWVPSIGDILADDWILVE